MMTNQPNGAAGIVGNGFAFVPSIVDVSLSTDSGVPQLAYNAGEDLSFSLWFKFTDAIDSNDDIWLMLYRGDIFNQLFVHVNKQLFFVDYIILEIVNGGDSDFVKVPFTLDATWHHLVVTYDAASGIATCFVDTVQLMATGIPVSLVSETGGEVGSWQFGHGGGAGVGAVVDEFGVFLGVKLTAADIDYLLNAGNGRTFPYA